MHNHKCLLIAKVNTSVLWKDEIVTFGLGKNSPQNDACQKLCDCMLVNFNKYKTIRFGFCNYM